MNLLPGLSAVMLLALSTYEAEARTCAKMYDASEACKRQTDCSADGDVLPQAGAHVPDMMAFEDKLSMVLVESECWLTIYLNEGFSGPCYTLSGYRCFDLASLGEPVGCNGHPGEFPGVRKSAAASAGDYDRDDVSYRVIDDLNTFDLAYAMQRLASNSTWDNVASSYKCDCNPDVI